MTKSITKWSAELNPPSAVVPMIAHAIALATSGRRGPVLLTLPIDTGVTDVLPTRMSRPAETRFTTDPRAIGLAASLLARSERPLLLVGSGARWGRGPAEVCLLAEHLRLPVATTPRAKGVFPEDHPLSLGVFGFGGHPSAGHYVESGIDTLLVLGSSLGEVSSNNFSPHIARVRDIVQVDVDASQIGRAYRASAGLLGEAEVVLPLLRAATERRVSPRQVRCGIRFDVDPERVGDGPEGAILPHRAIWELQRLLPKATIFTSDIGEHLLHALHYLRIPEGGEFCAMTALGSMGSGIGGALGFKLARPERPVVAICGDGGFLMSLGDIATAARQHIATVTFVLDDRRFGMCEIGHESVYGRRPDYSTEPVNVGALARGAGARVFEVAHTGEVLALGDIVHGDGPTVISVRIDRSLRSKSHGRNNALSRQWPLAN
jgi:acetolactate synthase-1/2/3 large subunit